MSSLQERTNATSPYTYQPAFTTVRGGIKYPKVPDMTSNQPDEVSPVNDPEPVDDKPVHLRSEMIHADVRVNIERVVYLENGKEVPILFFNSIYSLKSPLTAEERMKVSDYYAEFYATNQMAKAFIRAVAGRYSRL